MSNLRIIPRLDIKGRNLIKGVQLEGLRVLDTAGVQLGQVVEIVHTPGGELLGIRLEDGSDALVPFVTDFVPTVDLAAGSCVIDPPEGLLDLGRS